MTNNGQDNKKTFSELTHFIETKTSKVATALYMITDILPEGEPWKYETRTRALMLMHTTARLSVSYEVIQDVEVALHEVFALLTLAGTVRLLSDMNVRILVNEITAIQNELKGLKRGVSYPVHRESEQVDLESFFREVTPVKKQLPSAHIGISQKNIKDNQVLAMSFTQQRPAETVATVRVPNRTGLDLGLKINRTNTILQVIKDKKEVTIKDLAAYVPDCSEKTIQRELLTLVGRGVLKKQGEKRWSRYSLVS